MIFNNGSEYAGFERNYSSIDEITLPAFEDGAYPREPGFVFASPQRQWTYTAPNPADFYARVLSGTQRLPNGNTQICDGVSGTIFQVTPDGKTVWKYINPVPAEGAPVYQGDYPREPTDRDQSYPEAQNLTYRAPWYPPDYPGLKGMDLTSKGPIELYR